MKTVVLNHTSQRISPKALSLWIVGAHRILRRKKILTQSLVSVTVVVVSRSTIRRLNREYRKINAVTDILSFEATEPGSTGELIICWDVVRFQAKQHRLTIEQEAGYLLIHGLLHLLGYDHERGASEARRMFALQDEIFEKISGVNLEIDH